MGAAPAPGNDIATRRAIGLALLVMLTSASQGLAHHSVGGKFDGSRRVSLTGVITQIEWSMPHVYVYLDVTDDSGGVTQWRLESVPPAMLRRAGVTQAMLRGDGLPVTADAILPRRRARNLAWVTRITYSDGHHFQFVE